MAKKKGRGRNKEGRGIVDHKTKNNREKVKVSRGRRDDIYFSTNNLIGLILLNGGRQDTLHYRFTNDS